jgi:non-canonical poly(A) RNA polymerase PAPD5/7
MTAHWEESDFISLATADGLFAAAEDAAADASALPASAASYPWAPWASRDYAALPNDMLRLHEEIIDFCAFVSPTREEEALRAALVARVTALIHSLWPRAEVATFGSMATALYLPTSDIDMVVMGVSTDRSSFKRLEQALRDSQTTSYLEAILSARVPIVKFTDLQTGIAFDISIGVDGACCDCALCSCLL